MFETLGERLAAALKKITGRGVLRPEDVDAGLREVRLALLEADVNFKVVKGFVERVRARITGVEISPGLTAPQTVVKAVNDELVELLGGNSEGLRYSPQPPTVVMLVGLQGSGKTTAAVKLALLAKRDGHRPLVAALDYRRPAAVEQLKTLAERENVAFYGVLPINGDVVKSAGGAVLPIHGEVARNAGGPVLPIHGEVARSAGGAVAEAKRLNCDVVILDTAGRLHIDAELMDELKKLKAATPVTETLLVADSMTGQEAVKVGEAFGSAVGLDGVILTKLDGDARGGAALSLRVATGQVIRFAGVGEKPEDLEVFRAERMASRILGMGDVLTLIEKVERNVDQARAQEVERHLRAGQLSFDDFLAQIRQLRGMGSIEGMLDMVPGGGALKGQLAAGDPETEMKRMEAIILSMTPRERAHPDIIDGKRKRRIAQGSGVQPADINRLLKAREAMQQLAKQFGAPGRKGKLTGLPPMGRSIKGGAGW